MHGAAKHIPGNAAGVALAVLLLAGRGRLQTLTDVVPAVCCSACGTTRYAWFQMMTAAMNAATTRLAAGLIKKPEEVRGRMAAVLQLSELQVVPGPKECVSL